MTKDLPITKEQATLLDSYERRVATAMNDRAIAFAMVMAGHGIANAEVLGLDCEANTVRVDVPDSERKDG